MIGFGYNTKERTDRKFNTCGREKNPTKIRFFSTSLENAEPYRYVYWPDGDIAYECELQTEEIDAKLFDMEANFRSLARHLQILHHRKARRDEERLRCEHVFGFEGYKTEKEIALFLNH